MSRVSAESTSPLPGTISHRPAVARGVVAAGLVLLSWLATAATPGADAPPLAQPPSAIVLPPMHESRLANGLGLIVVPRRGLPVLTMMQLPLETLRQRADNIITALAGTSLRLRPGTGASQVGGGTLPQAVLPSVTLEIQPRGESLAAFATRLRTGTPPVIGFVAGGSYRLDLRTIFPAQDAALMTALRAVAVDRGI